MAAKRIRMLRTEGEYREGDEYEIADDLALHLESAGVVQILGDAPDPPEGAAGDTTGVVGTMLIDDDKIEIVRASPKPE